MLTAATGPPSSPQVHDSSPLSGPTRTCGPAATATPRRVVPTPGSTTARTTDGGRSGTHWASTAAARRTSWGGTWWVMSITGTSGARSSRTPLHAATKPSCSP